MFLGAMGVLRCDLFVTRWSSGLDESNRGDGFC